MKLRALAALWALGLMALSVAALRAQSDPTDYRYYFTVGITNASTSSLTNAPIPFAIYPANLVSGGFTQADGGDLYPTNAAGAPANMAAQGLPAATSTVWWMMVPSLAAANSQTFVVNTGHSTAENDQGLPLGTTDSVTVPHTALFQYGLDMLLATRFQLPSWPAATTTVISKPAQWELGVRQLGGVNAVYGTAETTAGTLFVIATTTASGGAFAVDTPYTIRLLFDANLSIQDGTTTLATTPGVPGPQTILFSATSTLTACSATTTCSVTHTTSGSDRGLIVPIAIGSGANTVTAVTYAGQPMTQQATAAGGGSRMYAYLLIDPPAGANTVTVTTSAPEEIRVLGISYTGVHSDSQPDATSTATGLSTNPSVTVTTASSSAMVIGALRQDAGGTFTPTAGTLRLHNTAQGFYILERGPISPPAATVLSGTTANGNWVWAALSLKPETGTSTLAAASSTTLTLGGSQAITLYSTTVGMVATTTVDFQYQPDEMALTQTGTTSNGWVWQGSVADQSGNSLNGTYSITRDTTGITASVGPLITRTTITIAGDEETVAAIIDPLAPPTDLVTGSSTLAVLPFGAAIENAANAANLPPRVVYFSFGMFFVLGLSTVAGMATRSTLIGGLAMLACTGILLKMSGYGLWPMFLLGPALAAIVVITRERG